MGHLSENKAICLTCIKVLMCLFFFNILLVDPVYGSTKSKKETEVDKMYRDIRDKMRIEFDKGDIQEVIEIYRENCCNEKSGKSNIKYEEKLEFRSVRKEIRADIYELLIKVYDFKNSQEQEDIYLEKWLKIKGKERLDEYYRRQIQYHAEKTYRVYPVLLLGLKLGLNRTIPHIGNRYTIFSPISTMGTDSYLKNYEASKIICGPIGAILEISLTPSISLKLLPSVIWLEYSYTNDYKWTDAQSNGIIDARFSHHQRIVWIELPVLLKYRFFLKPYLACYIQGGGFLRTLSTASKSINAKINTFGDIENEAIKSDITDKINNFQGGFQLGGGLEVAINHFLIKNIHFQFELNYNWAFTGNIIDRGKRFNNPELQYGFYDLLDDIRLNNLSLSLNILIPFGNRVFRR